MKWVTNLFFVFYFGMWVPNVNLFFFSTCRNVFRFFSYSRNRFSKSGFVLNANVELSSLEHMKLNRNEIMALSGCANFLRNFSKKKKKKLRTFNSTLNFLQTEHTPNIASNIANNFYGIDWTNDFSFLYLHANWPLTTRCASGWEVVIILFFSCSSINGTKLWQSSNLHVPKPQNENTVQSCHLSHKRWNYWKWTGHDCLGIVKIAVFVIENE